MLNSYKYLIFILFFSANLLEIQSGHIFTQPTEIIPQNAKYAKTFHMYFSIETTLISSDYIYIKFPFNLGSNPKATINLSMDDTVSLGSTSLIRAGGTDLEHFFTFLPGNSLLPSIWYRLTVISDETKLSEQIPGAQGCIILMTTSDLSNDKIIYDINTCADYLTLGPYIDETLFKVMGSYSSKNINTIYSFGQIYTAYFDITTSIEIEGGSIITLIIDQTSDFSFGTGCSSVICNSASGSGNDCFGYYDIPLVSGTCTTNGQILNFILNQKVLFGNIFRIQTNIVNSKTLISTPKSIKAIHRSMKSETWFSITTVISSATNGLNLKTAYPSFVITNNVKLFWGISYVTPSSSNFIGCPITLYRNKNGGNIIFNSVTSIISISNSIISLPGLINHIHMNWYPLESDDTILTMIVGSLSTNLPFLSGNSTIQSCTQIQNSSPNVKYINCKNIDTINSGTYIFSIKFSIAYSASVTSSAGTVGKIEFKTGENIPTVIATALGTSMAIKTNIEYADTTNLLESKVYKNSVFSYDLSANIFTNYPLYQTRTGSIDISNDVLANKLKLTFKCYFLGESCGAPLDYIGGRAGLWIKPSADINNIHGLFLPLQTDCPFPENNMVGDCSFCVTAIAGVNGCTQASLSSTNALSIMLKIIFNNNVLNIPSTELINGVYLVGYIFGILKTSDLNQGILIATRDYVADYGVNPLVNFISTNNGFTHLTLVCISANNVANQLASTAFKNCFTVSALNKVGGIAFHNTKIQTIPSIYVDDKINDFIICVKGRKRTEYSTLASVDETTNQWVLMESTGKAGPGLINSYIITKIPSTSYSSFVNYYIYGNGEIGSGNSYVTYLRVHATFANSYLTKGATHVGIFFDGAKQEGISSAGILSKYAFGNKLIAIDHEKGVSVLGTVIQGADETGDSTKTIDFWWSNSGVIIPSTITTQTSAINIYVPCLTGIHTLKSVNIVLFDQLIDSKYVVNSVYRIFGSVFDATAIRKGKKMKIIDIDESGSSYNVKKTIDNWVISGGKTAYEIGIEDEGCFDGATAANKIGFKDANTYIKPGSTIESTTIIADVPNYNVPNSCDINTGNNMNDATTPTLGSVYVIYNKEGENIFNPSSTLIWGHSANNINNCIFHNFAIYDNLNYPIIKTSFYTILCQADSYSNAVFGTGSVGVTITKFTVPFYWGKDYVISNKIHHVWSNRHGLAVTVVKDTSLTNSWYSSICKVGKVSSLPQNTKDLSYILGLTIDVSYRIPRFGSSGGILTIEDILATSNLNFIACSFVGPLVCSSSSNVFTITTPNSPPYVTTDYFLNKGNININIIVDTGNVIITTHSAIIRYNGFIIEYCSASEPVGFEISNILITSIIALDRNPKYINMKGARNSFSFSFSYSRIIRSNYYFEFNLGFFFNPTQSSNNARCVITNTNGVISSNFKSLATKDLTKVVLTSRKDMINGGTFYFKCIGGSTSDLTTNFDTPITVTYQRNINIPTVIGETTSDTNIPVLNNIVESVAPSSLSLIKLYRTSGMDSDYLINFLPYSNDITINGRIYVEFSSCISPRLNYGGNVECYLNEVPVFCSLIEERRIQIWPNIILYKNNTKEYTIRICGVTQPNEYDLNGNIYFALDSDNNVYNGILEQGFIKDIFDTTNSKPNIIYIHDFTFSSNLIRTITTISITVLLPANTLVNNANIFAQFPISFSKSLFYSPVVTCSLKRIGDYSEIEFAKSCNLLRGRKISIKLNFDPLNVNPLNYTLKFSNILNPQNINPLFFREDLIIFTLSTDFTTVNARTAVGNRNSTIFFGFISDPYSILLQWQNSDNFLENKPLDVSIGVYLSFPSLVTKNGENFNNTFSWQFGGTNSSSFITQQMNSQDSSLLKIVNGYSKSSFFIGGKETLSPGIYYLSVTKTGDISNTYSIPFMDIRAVLTSCNINLQGNNYNIPIGGFSSPIILDFSNCIPMTDITINANITNGKSFGLKFDNDLTDQSQTIKFDHINSNYKIYFYVYSETNLSNITTGSSQLVFTLSGTDKMYYNTPNTISINLIPALLEPPIVQTPQIYTTPGSSQFSFSCTQAGYLYFGLGLGNSTSDINIDQIAKITQNVKVSLTKPNPNDPTYSLYGYLSYPQANVFLSITINNALKAGDNYSIVVFCMNQNGVQSNRSNFNSFLQPDNLGKTLVLTIKFKNNQLSDLQKLDIACGLVRYFAIPPRRILTDDGFHCTSLQARLTQSIANLTELNSSSNSTILNINKTNDYNWFIIKDYFASNDQSYINFQTASKDLSFTNNVFKLTFSGGQSFPIVDSVSSFIIDSYSNGQNQLPIIIEQNYSVGLNYFSKILAIKNIEGYIFIGIGRNYSTKPNILQLRMGLDGNNSALVQKKKCLDEKYD